MSQKGFTLIELLAAMAIGSILTLAIVSSIFQIMQGRVGINQKSVAIADMDKATHWLTRDLVLAQTTDLIPGASPTDHMTLNWSDMTAWAQDEGSVEHSVSYTLSETQLLRDYDGEETIAGRLLTNVDFSITDKMF